MSDQPLSPELLAIRQPAPEWFHRAVLRPKLSRRVTVAGCSIHYLLWPADAASATGRGLLFVHGGGAHANWWSFLAPFFARQFRVAALDLSGMGDSGRRADYTAELRAEEIRAVIADAELGPQPFVVGHSFGGYMTMKFAALHGGVPGGVVIADSPIRSPEQEARRPLPRPPGGPKRVYPSFEEALARFRLMPEQSCDNPFLVEFIGRHSLMRAEGGWTWKFDPEAMGARRFGEPFHEYFQAIDCRAALLFGERSAIVSRDTVSYMSSLIGPRLAVVELPEAQHHLMLDQPLAFVAALRTLLASWIAADAARAGTSASAG